MKVFISWSGERSKAIAEALHSWIPNVLQAARPWMSPDIEKGARWLTEIIGELAETRFSIICLTPENLNAPWILFEAGALSKTIERTRVCPYLFGLEPTDVTGPLVQFQTTKSSKDDTKALMRTMNQALESALSEGGLDGAFEIWWPKLEKRLAAIPAVTGGEKPRRTDRDMIEELLELQRTQLQLMQGKWSDTAQENTTQIRGSPINGVDLRGDFEHVDSFCNKLFAVAGVSCDPYEHEECESMWTVLFDKWLFRSKNDLSRLAKECGVDIEGFYRPAAPTVRNAQ